MELYLSNRKIKNYLNAYLRNAEGQKVRVYLTNERPEPKTMIGWACYDRDYIRADYKIKTVVNGRKETLHKHLYESDIRNILAYIFGDYNLISMKITRTDFYETPNGVRLELADKKQETGPIRGYHPKRRM